jgi:hypothetical protein
LFINAFPQFQKGRILKTEMLENLRDFPRDFWDIFLHNYSDGIIAGAAMTVSDNIISITKGIVKFQEKLYLLDQELQLVVAAAPQEVFVKVKFDGPVVGSDFLVHNSRLIIETKPLQQDELELGRFKLNEGAQLRSVYRDFDDFVTEYNTLNIVHVPYAGLGKSTVSPMLIQYFLKQVIKGLTQNAFDISFFMQCFNAERVERDAILYYLTNRLSIPDKDYSNLEIYQYLRMIMKEMKSGSKGNVEHNGKKSVKIMID